MPISLDIIPNISTVHPFLQIHSFIKGGAIGCAQFSKKTDLNSKVYAFVGLAPATYVAHVRSPIRLFASFSKAANIISKIFTSGEFIINRDMMAMMQKAIGGTKNRSGPLGHAAFLLAGGNGGNLNSVRYLHLIATSLNSRMSSSHEWQSICHTVWQGPQ